MNRIIVAVLASIFVFSIGASAQTAKTNDDKNVVYTIPEVSPEFPGGIEALVQFINDNLKYPAEAEQMGVQGKVFIEFIIDTDGKISVAEVIRSSGHECLDEEALRVIRQMPKWKPGKQKGKNVRCKYRIPITFRLSRE